MIPVQMQYFAKFSLECKFVINIPDTFRGMKFLFLIALLSLYRANTLKHSCNYTDFPHICQSLRSRSF